MAMLGDQSCAQIICWDCLLRIKKIETRKLSCEAMQVEFYRPRDYLSIHFISTRKFNVINRPKESVRMGMTQRIFLAAILLIIDLVVFFMPLTAILLAYVIVFNPRWAREFINRLGTPPS